MAKRPAEESSILVQLSTKIKSIGTQIIKIKDKYYRIKELG
jgi:hypothetical protein